MGVLLEPITLLALNSPKRELSYHLGRFSGLVSMVS
jgi:hypothetical protein